MEDITNSWRNLSLSDREGDNMLLSKKTQSPEFSFIAIFLTKRALNIDAVARTFKTLWKSRNGFRLKSLGDHRLLVMFDNQSEMERIFENEPWSFDKHLVVLQRYGTDCNDNALTPLETNMWVQVHNIPLCYMNRETAEDICEVVGQVSRSFGDQDLGGEGFIRVRVKIDVNQPLCRGRIVTLENGEKTWVSFRYERLPNLYYWCGSLAHDDKLYPEWISSSGTLDQSKRKYNSSIRAALVNSSSRNSIYVPGYLEELKAAAKAKAAAGDREMTKISPTPRKPEPEKEAAELSSKSATISATDPAISVSTQSTVAIKLDARSLENQADTMEIISETVGSVLSTPTPKSHVHGCSWIGLG